MGCMIRQSRRAVSFEQVFFSSSLEGCSSGDADGLVTGFPVFDLPTAAAAETTRGGEESSREEGGSEEEQQQLPTSQCQWTSWDYTAGYLSTSTSSSTSTSTSSKDGGGDQSETEGAPGAAVAGAARGGRRMRGGSLSLEAPGFLSPTCREWSAAAAAAIPAGITGTGPMVIWSETESSSSPLSSSTAAPSSSSYSSSYSFATAAASAVVLSPMLNAMAINAVPDPDRGTLAFGVMGNVTALPAGFAARVVAYFGPLGGGINVIIIIHWNLYSHAQLRV
jgi:hypothetical protein